MQQDTCVSHEVRSEECVLDLAVNDQADRDVFLADLEDIAFLEVIGFHEVSGDITMARLKCFWRIIVLIEEVEGGL